MVERHQPAKKIFSYEEAVALLPEVRRLTEEAVRAIDALGAVPDAEGKLRSKTQAEVDAVVTRWAETLVGLGLEVKGLWLVDFDNGSGYYCWRPPEPGLHFYHSYEDGFGGRMRIQ